ncbi:MAG: type IV secretory system conjugative DNA transfer family protein [Candidatus Bathyarchaeota archaeon]|nr:type IV secretory system conjugative DNA transfer family protein [Candidatus Bathyarchaeota archaeon]
MHKFDVEEAKETGFYVSGTSGSGKTTLAKHLVKDLILNGCTVIVLDASRAWSTNSPINNTVTLNTPLQNNPTRYPVVNTVFDMTKLAIAERFTFCDKLCEATMQSRINAPNPKKLDWLFLVFEEAQLYLSNGCMRSLHKYGNVLNVISNGRNFNVRFGIITQFPANVDKAPVKITQQRYFGLTTEKNDLTYIKSFFNTKQEAEQVRNLEKLEFMYQYRGKTEKIKTYYFGDAPKKYELTGYQIELPTYIL